MLIESLSGVRGYDTALTADLLRAYASAFTEAVGRDKILLGRDTRASGAQIQEILATALRDAGAHVILLGICPTPTVQFAVENQKASGGIVITASHNPLPWNGLKFIGSDGLFLDGSQMQRLKERRLAIQETLDRHTIQKGSAEHYANILDDHIRSVLQIPYIRPHIIRARKFKIVFDAVNGAGYAILPRLLEQLGCELTCLNCHADRPFPRSPEPLPENLGEVMQAIRKESADLGLVVDPDADRLAILSDSGAPISEEFTLVLAARLVLGKSTATDKSIVTNLSTTMAVDDIARKFKARVYRTPIGEINVAQKMRDVGATIGGEGNGGVLLPEAHLGRDSLVASVLVLQLLAELNRPLSQIMDEMPHYVMHKQKIERGNIRLADVIPDLKSIAGAARSNSEDGIKFIWDDAWVHLRPSNTEPIIRIYAEGMDRESVEQRVRPFSEYFRKNV